MGSEVRGLIFAWLLIALAGAAVVAAFRLFAGVSPVVPPQRRRAAGWTGPLVTAAFLIFYLVGPIILAYIDPPALATRLYGHAVDEKTAEVVGMLVADLAASPLQIAAWYALGWFAGGRRPVFGVVPRRMPADFSLAFRTWLILTPAVYAVSFVSIIVYHWFSGQQPAGHPLMVAVQAGRAPGWLIVITFVQAVIAAPVREELFFRGILQPFLADRPWGGDLALMSATVIGLSVHKTGAVAFTDPLSLVSVAAPLLLVLAVLPIYRIADSWDLSRWLPLRDPARRRQAGRAIVGTAILFANFHANVWPTPVPLFVLALGLGWLAFRTQGVVASTVLHVLFNAIAFLALPLQVPPPAGP
jgi:membrane protease YdiL (CAAX protease family)